MANPDSAFKAAKSRLSSRRRGSLTTAFNKHRSAPLTSLTQQFNNAASSIEDKFRHLKAASPSAFHQPLIDISNHISHKSGGAMNFGAKFDDAQPQQLLHAANCPDAASHQDVFADLENLLYGTEATSASQQHLQLLFNQQFIKQSLDIDANCNNLIGDRSKQHVLPVIPSAKHTDLHCIAPETVSERPASKTNPPIPIPLD